MSRACHACALLVALLLCVSVDRASAAVPPPSSPTPPKLLPVGEVVRHGNLFVMATPMYQVETDVSPETTRLVAEHMEAVGRAYQRLFTSGRQAPLPRFRVRVYKDRTDYLAVVPPQYANTAGLYAASQRTLYASLGTDDLDTILGTLRHEGWHQFIHSVLHRVPPWADEGLAEYFSYARVQKGELIQGELPGMALRAVQRAIREGTILPLSQLTGMDLQTWNETLSDSPERGKLNYDEAFMVAHFLMQADAERFRPAFTRYLVLVDNGMLPERAFIAAFQDSPEALTRRWQPYVMAAVPSPRFLCRENLTLIGAILLNSSRGRQFTPESLAEALAQRRLGEWSVGARFGRVIRSGDAAAIRGLFACPADADGAKHISYVFHYADAAAKLPEITCSHHPDFILRFWYSFDPSTQRWLEHLEEKPRP